MTTGSPSPTTATATTPTTAPLGVAGVGEMPTTREVVTILFALFWTVYTGFFGKTEATSVWFLFFGIGFIFDAIDTGWRFHYRKEWADQILWWTQPHYILAAMLGVLVDWVYPVNLTLSFIVTVIIGVILSIPIERYYISLKDTE
jgi:hypothetical protein